jgi:hypothetical protein
VFDADDCIGEDAIDVDEVMAECGACITGGDGSDACNALCHDDGYGSDDCSGYGDFDSCEDTDYCYWDNGSCVHDGPPACLEDCTGIDDFHENGPSDQPDVFCTWLTSTYAIDPCTDDCSDYPEDHAMIMAYDNACDACLAAGSGCQEAMDALEYIYDDHCYDWMDEDNANGCSDIDNQTQCNSYDECYWEDDVDAGFTGTCETEGPPSCVWDCEGICEWEDNENDEDPLGFCEWLVNADAGGCTSDCMGADATEVQEYVALCELCINSDDPESDACMAIDDGGDDCYDVMML